jgi:hypothetical protein
MARWAIGDIQGCAAELRTLLARLRFNPDLDQLWFTGDIVNRGPDSLGALRLVHSLRDNAAVVLGNHDLHLLALACAGDRPRRGDTLDDVLAARDRRRLLAWLRSSLAVHDVAHGDPLARGWCRNERRTRRRARVQPRCAMIRRTSSPACTATARIRGRTSLAAWSACASA